MTPKLRCLQREFHGVSVTGLATGAAVGHVDPPPGCLMSFWLGLGPPQEGGSRRPQGKPQTSPMIQSWESCTVISVTPLCLYSQALLPVGHGCTGHQVHGVTHHSPPRAPGAACPSYVQNPLPLPEAPMAAPHQSTSSKMPGAHCLNEARVWLGPLRAVPDSLKIRELKRQVLGLGHAQHWTVGQAEKSCPDAPVQRAERRGPGGGRLKR